MKASNAQPNLVVNLISYLAKDFRQHCYFFKLKRSPFVSQFSKNGVGPYVHQRRTPYQEDVASSWGRQLDVERSSTQLHRIVREPWESPSIRMKQIVHEAFQNLWKIRWSMKFLRTQAATSARKVVAEFICTRCWSAETSRTASRIKEGKRSVEFRFDLYIFETFLSVWIFED